MSLHSRAQYSISQNIRVTCQEQIFSIIVYLPRKEIYLPKENQQCEIPLQDPLCTVVYLPVEIFHHLTGECCLKTVNSSPPNLHFSLPIKQSRVRNKFLPYSGLLVFKIFRGLAPSYLSFLIISKPVSKCNLRSSSDGTLLSFPNIKPKDYSR